MFKTGCAPAYREACIICGAGPTVKSHLLPAAIAQDIRGDQKALWVGSISQDGKRITQSGTFDRFLCETHEAGFHGYEDPTIDFCRDFALSQAELASGAFVRPDADADALVRFAASVLWRFHISALPETRRVDVGGWEPGLRAVTFGGSIEQAPDVLIYGVVTDRLPVSRFAIPPAVSRFDGRRVWSFILSGVGFMVKLDKQPFSPRIHRGVINGKAAVLGVVKALNRDDLAGMKAIAARMQASRALT